MDAVKQALNLIKQRGLVLITMYSGHEGGKDEKDALLDYASQLSSKEYHAAYFNLINSPIILRIIDDYEEIMSRALCLSS